MCGRSPETLRTKTSGHLQPDRNVGVPTGDVGRFVGALAHVRSSRRRSIRVPVRDAGRAHDGAELCVRRRRRDRAASVRWRDHRIRQLPHHSGAVTRERLERNDCARRNMTEHGLAGAETSHTSTARARARKTRRTSHRKRRAHVLDDVRQRPSPKSSFPSRAHVGCGRSPGRSRRTVTATRDGDAAGGTPPHRHDDVQWNAVRHARVGERTFSVDLATAGSSRGLTLPRGVKKGRCQGSGPLPSGGWTTFFFAGTFPSTLTPRPCPREYARRCIPLSARGRPITHLSRSGGHWYTFRLAVAGVTLVGGLTAHPCTASGDPMQPPRSSSGCTSGRSVPRRCPDVTPTSRLRAHNPAIYYVGTGTAVYGRPPARRDVHAAVPGPGLIAIVT